MKKKIFHDREDWDGTAVLLKSKHGESIECTECGAPDVTVIELYAEINAGEIYSVNVCEDCIKRFLTMFCNDKNQ